MKYPISELCDRISIERLKEERIPDYVSQFKTDAMNYLFSELPIPRMINISHWLDELYKWNGKIWDLESDIRKGKEGELGIEEVGRRALKIREFNNKRVEAKNKIAEMLDQYIEVKYNHASR